MSGFKKVYLEANVASTQQIKQNKIGFPTQKLFLYISFYNKLTNLFLLKDLKKQKKEKK